MHRPRSEVALLAMELLVGVTAVPCGGLLMINGLGMPREALDNSPFDSFVVPGIVLAVVVGGSLLAAAWHVLAGHRFARWWSLGAGCILLGWIGVEAILVRDGRPLQVVILTCALAILGLAWQMPGSGSHGEASGPK